MCGFLFNRLNNQKHDKVTTEHKKLFFKYEISTIWDRFHRRKPYYKQIEYSKPICHLTEIKIKSLLSINIGEIVL